VALILFCSLQTFGAEKPSLPNEGDSKEVLAACEHNLTRDEIAQPGVKKSDIGEISNKPVNDPYFLILPSGRDADVIPLYRQFVDELNRPGGVADQLGLPRTNQVVQFLKGTDLNAIAKGGLGQPVAHYLDGSKVLEAYRDTRSLIYEVVYPGPEIQHGFYRDDNPPEQQLSILLHVMGHNHFALRSFFPHYRAAHVIHESLQLDSLLSRLYQDHDKDEVLQWYLFLQTLMPLMDFYAAYYQTPEEFVAEPFDVSSANYRRQVQSGQRPQARHPRRPTENVLAAFVANIPTHAPEWKKEIAEHLVKMMAFQPALVHTQIMNEGWASLCQELIIRHMGEYNTFNHWVSAMKVMQTEATPNLQDPYSLGVSAWRRLYEKFMKRPEVKRLPTLMERDRQFILWADSEVISRMDDFQFLRLALDREWVESKKLSLVRAALPQEIDKDRLKPPPADLEDPYPWIVTSRDPERIVQNILTQSVYGKFRFRPRVQLRDFSRLASGEVELVIDDEIGNALPMDRTSTAPALFALSQILEKPISLEAMIHNPKYERRPANPFLGGFWSPFDMQDIDVGEHEDEIVRARLVVAPNGALTVYRVDTSDRGQKTEQRFAQVEEEYGAILHAYLADLFLEDDTRMEWLTDHNPTLASIVTQMSAQLTNEAPIDALAAHAPTVPKALEEYFTMVQRRTGRAMERAMAGRGGLRNTNRGLYLKALPSAPHLQFDGQFIQKLAGEAEVEPVQPQFGFAVQARPKSVNPFDGDQANGGQVSPVDGSVGDFVWGPNPNGGKGGSGDKEPDGQKASEGRMDPSYVPITEEFYAKFLGERVKLPNLSPKAGQTRLTKKVRRGRRNQKTGVMLPAQILMNAVKKGIGATGEFSPDDVDMADLAEVGIPWMHPRQDWVVKSMKEKPVPDINAVVTFVMDASGSTKPYWDIYKRMIFDLKTLIKHNYSNVVFRWVVFDTAAKIVDGEKEFFQIQLGGGTSYKAGVDKVRELQEESYPRGEWDRFSFFFGDMDDFGDEGAGAFRSLVEESEFVGALRTGPESVYYPELNGLYDLNDELKALSEEDSGFGYVDLGARRNYNIEDLRRLLKNNDEN
jgi:hypothetical protein